MNSKELKSYTKIISDKIYEFYGSDSDILFGISSSKKEMVEIIIGLTIEYYLAEIQKENNDESKNK